MIYCNLFGGGFQHASSTTLNKKSKSITWNYNKFINEKTFYIDNSIIQGLNDKKSKVKFGILLESKFVVKDLKKICVNNVDILKKEYRYIFTHDYDLLKIDPELFKYCPANGTWIDKPKIYNKNKLVSMISSAKNFTPGHKFRLKFINQYKSQLDLFGRGFNEIKYKEEGLKDYMFSICIENGNYDCYFTEKILDCFACGTIPVYYGTSKISDYFDSKGIVFIDSNFNINNLTKRLYESKINSINYNFSLIENYYTVEDYIYQNYLIEE